MNERYKYVIVGERKSNGCHAYVIVYPEKNWFEYTHLISKTSKYDTYEEAKDAMTKYCKEDDYHRFYVGRLDTQYYVVDKVEEDELNEIIKNIEFS